MKVQLFEDIASGAPFVAPILVARLRTLRKDPAGAHTLSSLGVAIGIRVDVGTIVGVPPDGAKVELEAQSGNAAAFPVFAGILRVVPVDAFRSRLALTGVYRVPLGALGEVADRTVLAGIAKRSLQTFLGEIRGEIEARVLHEATSH
jgi:hypothetical protein